MKSTASSQRRSQNQSTSGVGPRRASIEEALRPQSGLVPAGDVRLTANIRSDLHLALKIRAARERTTIGELIEDWVSTWKEDD